MALLIDIEKLNSQERLELANYLWDSIKNPKHELIVSDLHKEVLDERIENKTLDTTKLKTWGALKLELTQKHNLCVNIIY
jgi:putative addiction module component (TIGR02574 family)